MKIALFGGSFDPVHNAHIDIIKNLTAIFDKVIVLPCYISPFKTAAKIVPAKMRLQMLQLALKGMDKVELSDFELQETDCSFTYLTLRHFREKYENAGFYIVIGSEEVARIYEWKNIEEILDSACFFVVPRPHFFIQSCQLSDKILLAPFIGKDGSSTEIKAAIAFNEEHLFLPRNVAAFIEENELYRDYCRYTKEFERFSLKPERIKHTYRAVQAGIILAKKNKVSLEETIIALILHDIGKYLNAEDLEKMGIPFDKSQLDGMPQTIIHAPIGVAIARHFFKIENEQILEAISDHTTAKPNMTTLSKVVFLSDYVESGRKFKKIELIRDAAFRNLDLGLYLALKNTIEFLGKNEIYYQTTLAYEYYDKLYEDYKEIL